MYQASNYNQQGGAGASAGGIGAWGEAEAARHLERKGYVVETRNWRSPRDHRDELDLICRDGELWVFVEVKTRRAGALVRGLASLDRRKQSALRRAIRAFLASFPARLRPRYFRFDVVEVEHGPVSGDFEVLHFENFPLLRGRLW